MQVEQVDQTPQGSPELVMAVVLARPMVALLVRLVVRAAVLVVQASMEQTGQKERGIKAIVGDLLDLVLLEARQRVMVLILVLAEAGQGR